MRTPRDWQERCLTEIKATARDPNERDFLAAVTPGAGKTFLGVETARQFMAEGRIDAVVALVPSINIRKGWERDAAEAGIALTAHTYHSLKNGAGVSLRAMCAAQRVMVIGDEIHHSGVGKPWGRAVETATRNAAFRLGLTGTPFRTDNSAINFLRYRQREGQTRSVPHFELSYGEALKERIVAPLYFRWMNGRVEFNNRTLTFDDRMTPQESSQLLNAAVSADENFTHKLLDAAHAELLACRTADPTAAGLVIAKSIGDAKKIKRYLDEVLHANVVVVTSKPDDEAKAAAAQEAIETFKASYAHWLVSVGMVSEGVDIPRLKVLAYLSTNKTRLVFGQAMGRLTRLMDGRADQSAMVYLPKLAQFQRFARTIQESVWHVLGPHTPPLPPRHIEGVEWTVDRDGQVVMSSDGWIDGLILGDATFTEAQMARVEALYCDNDFERAEIAKNRTVWCGKWLKAVSKIAAQNRMTLDNYLAEGR